MTGNQIDIQTAHQVNSRMRLKRKQLPVITSLEEQFTRYNLTMWMSLDFHGWLKIDFAIFYASAIDRTTLQQESPRREDLPKICDHRKQRPKSSPESSKYDTSHQLRDSDPHVLPPRGHYFTTATDHMPEESVQPVRQSSTSKTGTRCICWCGHTHPTKGGLREHQQIEHAECWCSLCGHYFEYVAAHRQSFHASLSRLWNLMEKWSRGSDVRNGGHKRLRDIVITWTEFCARKRKLDGSLRGNRIIEYLNDCNTMCPFVSVGLRI